MMSDRENTVTSGVAASDSGRAQAITEWLTTAPSNTDHEAVRRHLHDGAALGLHLLLVDPGTKTPFTPPGAARRRADNRWMNHTGGGSIASEGAPPPRAGVYLATTDKQTLDRYVKAYVREHGDDCPVNVAVAVAASGLAVIDADTPEQVAAFLTASEGGDGADRTTPTVQTPGVVDEATGERKHWGGGHWYYVVPEGSGLPDKDTKVSVDGGGDFAALAGQGRYVVVPPSSRAEGEYKATGVVEVLPAWLRERIADTHREHVRATVEARRKIAERLAAGELTDEEWWGNSITWAEMLSGRGWSNTGDAYSCGCDIWTAPGSHANPHSAIAHEPGCPDFDRPDPPLVLWTDHDYQPFDDCVIETDSARLVLRLPAFAAIHHNNDMEKARMALGIELDIPTRATVIPHWREDEPADDGDQNSDADDGTDADDGSCGPPADGAGTRVPFDVLVEDAAKAKVIIEARIAEADALFDHSPVLRHIAAHADRRGSSRVACLAQVLMRVGLSIPPVVVLPAALGGDNVGLSTLNAVVGATSGGKGRAEAIGRDCVAIRYQGKVRRFEPLRPSTGEGLASIFASADKGAAGEPPVTVINRPAALLSFKDIESFDALVHRSGNSLAGELLSLYMGDALGFVTRDVNRRVVIPAHTIQAGLSVGVHPDRSTKLLEKSMISTGLPHRFLWMPVRNGRRTQRGAPPPAITIDLPDYGVLPADDPHTMPEFLPGEGVADSSLVPIGVASAVADAIMEADLAKGDDVFGFAPDGEDQMFGHSALTQLKAAACLGALHGETAISSVWWELGGLLANVSNATMSAAMVLSEIAARKDAREQGAQYGYRSAASDRVRDDETVRSMAEKLYARVGTEWKSVHATSMFTPSKRALIPDAWSMLIAKGRVERRDHKNTQGNTVTQYRRTA